MTTTQRIIKELHIMGAISEQTALNAKEVAELADTKQAHTRLCELRDQGLVIASSRTGKNKYWLTLAGAQYAETMEASNNDQANNAIENSELTDDTPINEATSQANSENIYMSKNSDKLDEFLDIPPPQYNPDDVAFKKVDITESWYMVDGIDAQFETSSDAIAAAHDYVATHTMSTTVHIVASRKFAIIKPVVTTELEYL